MVETDLRTDCRRQHLRLNYLAAVTLSLNDGTVIKGNLRDIGIQSLFAKIENCNIKELNFKEFSEVAISVTQGDSKMTITILGKPLRQDDDGVAISFSEPLKWWPIFSLFPVTEQFLFDIVAKA